MEIAEQIRRLCDETVEQMRAAGVLAEHAFRTTGRVGFQLDLCRADDRAVAKVQMTPTTEAFGVHLDGGYEHWEYGYNVTDKLEAANEVLTTARRFVERDYVEDLCVRNGRVLRRTIVLGHGNDRFGMTWTYGGLVGMALRVLGGEPVRVHPT